MSSGGRKSILIGVPCYSGVSPEVLEDLMSFAYHCGRRMPEYDFLSGIKSKSEQFRARNAIIDQAVQLDVDYVLMLDDDMVININNDRGVSSSYDFLSRMIKHDKDIVGALYYQRQGECSPVAMMEAGHGYRFLRQDEIKGNLQRVDVVGGGCMLIKTRIFDRIQRPYFEPEFTYGTDIQLCRKARDAGFEVWLDSSIELGHVRQERTIVTSRNRSQFMNDAIPGEARMVTSDVYDRLIADVEEYTGFSREQFGLKGNEFMRRRSTFDGSDHEWYRLYGKERVARQAWFNAGNPNKRAMTEFILSSVNDKVKADVLDFGCGIGIPAFALAERGHSVVAMDLEGTETLRFLSWRANKYMVPIDVRTLSGPVLPTVRKFDVIIAMDCLEHIENWPDTLAQLAKMLKPEGVLFSNNAILDDDAHPEHYHIDNGEFVSRCVENGLMPINQIAYVKKEKVAHAV